MMLREGLLRITSEYLESKKQNFKGHSLGRFIRNEFPDNLKQLLEIEGTTFKTKGSCGQSSWADVPWLAVMDSLVTEGTSKGYYVVYLFSADMTSIYLALGQAVYSVEEEFGIKKMHEILKNRASIIRARVPSYSKAFDFGEVKLNGTTKLAKNYEYAPAFYVKYDPSNLPDEDELRGNLIEVTNLYSDLILAGGVDLIDDRREELRETGNASLSVTEKKLFREHRRVEGRVNSNKVKIELGYICQACGFDFERTYGDIGKGYIEAHHKTPYSELALGAKRTLNIKKDFLVLCSNCHRMIHRMGSPENLEGLQKLIKGNS